MQYLMKHLKSSRLFLSYFFNFSGLYFQIIFYIGQYGYVLIKSWFETVSFVIYDGRLLSP